jgi:ferritin
MLTKPMLDALNEQINKEMYSAYLYLSMSMWFETQQLPGFAHWMKAQFIEEETHALRFADYINDHDEVVTLTAIAKPTATFASTLDVFEQTLAHEKTVTASIKALHTLAVKENDFATQSALLWFINEQVEEEKNATLIRDQVKAIGTMQALLYMFDGHMDERKASLSVG